VEIEPVLIDKAVSKEQFRHLDSETQPPSFIRRITQIACTLMVQNKNGGSIFNKTLAH
jgi:hypothetical protein